jgi:glycosyltransferase involved in cell wall biosynthesis
MFTYTIIIPHRNIPKLLQRCLDSIPHRDDLHIIVVDDNSDPNKVDFEHFPGYDRNDVELIFTKEGKGAGYARNVGLEHTNSKKVLFADADDFFNYCLNDILDKYKNESADIVFFNACCLDSEFYTTGNRCEYLGLYIKKFKSNPQEAGLRLKYDLGAPWCKLINKSLIDEHHIKFDESPVSNDTTFSYLIGYHSKSIKADRHAIYCLTFRPDSLTYTDDENRILARMDVLGRRDKFLKDNVGYENHINLHYKILVELKKSKNKELYNKCIDVLVSKGLNKKEIERKVLRRLLGEKKAKIKKLLHF